MIIVPSQKKKKKEKEKEKKIIVNFRDLLATYRRILYHYLITWLPRAYMKFIKPMLIKSGRFGGCDHLITLQMVAFVYKCFRV